MQNHGAFWLLLKLAITMIVMTLLLPNHSSINTVQTIFDLFIISRSIFVRCAAIRLANSTALYFPDLLLQHVYLKRWFHTKGCAPTQGSPNFCKKWGHIEVNKCLEEIYRTKIMRKMYIGGVRSL